MGWIALGLGLVLVIEGLVFALAPSRLDELVAIMAALSREQRRMIGLVAVAIGVGLVWLGAASGRADLGNHTLRRGKRPGFAEVRRARAPQAARRPVRRSPAVSRLRENHSRASLCCLPAALSPESTRDAAGVRKPSHEGGRSERSGSYHSCPDPCRRGPGLMAALVLTVVLFLMSGMPPLRAGCRKASPISPSRSARRWSTSPPRRWSPRTPTAAPDGARRLAVRGVLPRFPRPRAGQPNRAAAAARRWARAS